VAAKHCKTIVSVLGHDVAFSLYPDASDMMTENVDSVVEQKEVKEANKITCRPSGRSTAGRQKYHLITAYSIRP